MKEHPILFTGDMVKAILEGRKTQTRRVMKPQPVKSESGFWEWAGGGWSRDDVGGVLPGHSIPNHCPYGQWGDRLWVRETFCYAALDGFDARTDGGEFWYKATDTDQCEGPWSPSIHMPKRASRITLEIVDLRVERLQHITVEDVRAEGIKHTQPDGYWLAPLAGTPDFPWNDARMAYASLWNSINEKRGYGWDKNPWVWVITFKRI